MRSGAFGRLSRLTVGRPQLRLQPLARLLSSASVRSSGSIVLSSALRSTRAPTALASLAPGFSRSIALHRLLSTDAKPDAASATASSASTTSTNTGSGGGLVARLQALLFDNRERLRTYLVYASILGGAILILKGGIWLVEFFGNINFADVGEVAYVAGIATGLALVGMFSAAKRLVSIRPEPVYRMILKNVTCNAKVTSRLGEHLAPGKFRAYSVIEGGLRWGSSDGKQYDGWQRFWKPKRIQMLFTVTGSRGTGMISAEVQNDTRGKPYYRVLALDVMDGKGERYIIDGDPTYRVDHGPVKLN